MLSHVPDLDRLAGAERAEQPRRDARGNISRRIVQLHKEYYGRGPTRAKTYINGDLVVVLMRGGFTRVEETLLEEGRGDAVIAQRMDFQEVMEDRFKQVIEEETGRKVLAMMSGNHQHPDLLGEMFVLESTDILDDEPRGSLVGD
jgi:uncharacterized protein YbcI